MTARMLRRTTAATGLTAALLSVFIVTSPTVSATQNSDQQCTEPIAGQRFSSKEPSDAGMNSAAVADALDFGTRAGGVAIQIYRHGCLIGDRTPTANLPIPIASATKGITSVVIGRAISMGYFELDDPIGKFFPHADSEHARLTIRQILTQTTGLRFSWPADIAGLYTDSSLQTLAAPVDYPPETTFQYAQNVIALLPKIVEITTGIDFQDFTQNEIMDPLGIARGNWIWLRDRSGVTAVNGGLAMRPDDLGRFGQLMLANGRWRDRQLVDPAYITEARTGTTANPGYGFLTWLNSSDSYKGVEVPSASTYNHPQFPGSPRDLYSFEGALGQFVTIVPSRDLVIVRLGIPTRIDLANPVALLTGSGNPDTKELYQRIIASATDLPAEPYVDPYTLENPGLSISNLEDLGKLVDPVNAASILLGVGPYSANGCNLLWCNGKPASEDLLGLILDISRQVTDAAHAANNTPR